MMANYRIKNKTKMAGKPVNILVLDHFNQIGGGQLYLMDVMRYLSQTSCHMFTMDSPLAGLHSELERSGVTILPVRSSGWRDVFKPWKLVNTLIQLIAAVKRHRIDIIHTNTAWCQCLGSWVKLICRRPVLWNYHDMAQFDWLGKGFKFIMGIAADRIVVPSRASAEKLNVFPEKIAVIGNGFSLKTFETDRRHHRDGHDQFVIAWIGRIIPWKNLESMLMAAEILKKKNISVQYRVYGDGKSDYMIKIRSLIRKLDIDDVVTLSGFVADIPACIYDSDVVVNTSMEPESFGRTMIEAALCRRPVIATALGATPETVVDNQTGLLIPPGNPRALADAVVYMIENPVHRKQMAEYAFKRATKKYNINTIGNLIENQYRMLHNPTGSE